jgi:cyclopropane fatty-acyl-phospholipid synthase-like methyltransferase
MDTITVGGTFDAIVMMDVYEHIPRSRVRVFHDVLAGMLTPGGSVLLTTPSPLHQARLAATNPEALQIVDETIGVEEIAELARAIGGTVTSFNYKAVWRSNDYVHTVIERAPRHEKLADKRTVWRKLLDKPGGLWAVFKSTREQGRRERHVRRTLGSS